MISHPIFDSTGNYLGYVAGTIYLLENNILNELLGEHFYQDGSYVFVVDGEGNIIYHPNPSRVNDTYGHSIGDEVLKFLAAEMRAAIREGDTCCRYGGEEFIILLPDTTLEDTFKIAENLRKVIENKVSPTGNPITISGGIANYPLSGDHAMQVIEVADAQLYRAKENGRNKICGEDYMIV